MSSNFSSTINFLKDLSALKASNQDLRLCLPSMDFLYDP
ncbi:hypothetical protein COO91_03008 [Nostoc flagelliforme CCNUN1]|uniref:Uncharacterized protein n=1 Tax=Nostoc flagelliforme CCNUN1 TaxID=2038116 RepID=A0A2K8SNN2_9NOSO|nr:hypothetical protein COO91_03008 [Nostoc flagelliforme CCNUN1]